MKKSLVLFVVFVLLLSFSVTASAKMKKTFFEGVGSTVGLLAPPECTTPDGNEHCRGLVLRGLNDFSDDRLAGYETITMNWNFREDGSGPWWGSGEIENSAGEIVWDVQYTGQRNADLSGYLNCVARGRGEYKGLKAFYTGVRSDPDPAPFVFHGYILEKDGS